MDSSEAYDTMLEEAARLRDLGRHDDAISILRRVLECDPQNVAALIIIGTIYSTLNRFNDAAAVFVQARTLRPRHSLVSAGVFHSCLDAGRIDDAIAEARRYVALLDSENPPKIKSELPHLENTYRAWATDDEAALRELRDGWEAERRESLHEDYHDRDGKPSGGKREP